MRTYMAALPGISHTPPTFPSGHSTGTREAGSTRKVLRFPRFPLSFHDGRVEIMTRVFLTFLLAFPLAAVAQASQPRLPNIIHVLADDVGYDDLSCYSAPKIKTPNIDKLAAEGMRFTNFYAPSPVCT